MSVRPTLSRREALVAAVILGSLTLLYFWPQLVGGRALYWGDIGLYFLPMQTFARENLCAGRLPLWNPRILCGTPYVGNPQTWLLYPVSALLRFVSAPVFLNVTVALHIWLAGLGTYLFARRALTVGPLAALAAAVTFGFGGELVSKEQFPNMVQAMAYLPWVLLFLDRLVSGQRLPDALCLGAALGLQVLAAHAQITLLTLYLGLAYGLRVLAGLPTPERREFVLKGLGFLLLVGAVAIGLAAGQFLPTAELYHDAWRQKLSFEVVNRFYLPLNESANFVLPNLHGHPYRGDFRAWGNYWETCAYVGWLPLLAALAGLRRNGFWVAVFLVGVWMARGGGGGLYHVAYWVLPGFRSFHDPARCLFWACFALALLAAAGFQQILTRIKDRDWAGPVAAVLLLLAFADLLHFGRTLYPLAAADTLRPQTRLVSTLQADPDIRAHQARFIAPDSARVWQRFTVHRSYRQNAPGYFSFWTDTLTPNLMMPHGLPDAYGYEPVVRRDAEINIGTAVTALRPEAPPEQRQVAAIWAGFLGVRYVAGYRQVPLPETLPGLTTVLTDPTLPPVRDRGFEGTRASLALNSRWQPRARLMTSFVAVPTAEEAQVRLTVALLHPETLDLARTVVVAGRVPFATQPGPITAVPIQDRGPDQVTLDFRTSRPSLLVLADVGHPGWRASLDGRPVQWLTANGCLRAVPVPTPGAHEVVFSYQPMSFRVGLYLTLLSLAGLVGAAVFAASRNSWPVSSAKQESRPEMVKQVR